MEEGDRERERETDEGLKKQPEVVGCRTLSSMARGENSLNGKPSHRRRAYRLELSEKPPARARVHR